jgi:hypothetical protein
MWRKFRNRISTSLILSIERCSRLSIGFDRVLLLIRHDEASRSTEYPACSSYSSYLERVKEPLRYEQNAHDAVHSCIFAGFGGEVGCIG